METVKCNMQCGFSRHDCEFCKDNEARQIIGDEEAWEQWHEHALKILKEEPSARQAFRAAWLKKGSHSPVKKRK